MVSCSKTCMGWLTKLILLNAENRAMFSFSINRNNIMFHLKPLSADAYISFGKL